MAWVGSRTPTTLLALLWHCVRASAAQLIVKGVTAPPRQPTTAASAAATESIRFMQWNLHGECFVQCGNVSDSHCDKQYPACKEGALALVKDLVAGEQQPPLDFVGVEMLNDEDFLRAGLDPAKWGRFTQLCGGEHGFGVYPFDSATLYYDKARWGVVPVEGVAPGGCMEFVMGNDDTETPAQNLGPHANNYRAYMVQAFSHLTSGEKVVVVTSHHPHVFLYHDEIKALKETVAEIQAKTGITKLVLIADTNVNCPGSPFPGGGRASQSVMEDIYPDAGEVVSTKLAVTCCAWTYVHTFDRIIAAGFPAGSSMVTEFPFKPSRPDWVAVNMHDPVLGTLKRGPSPLGA